MTRDEVVQGKQHGADDPRQGAGLSRALMLGTLAGLLAMIGAGVSWYRALPRFWRCRTSLPGLRCVHSGHEAAAIGGLRTLNTAQSIYRDAGKSRVQGQARYASSLAELSAPGVDYIDDILGTGMKLGFDFRLSASPGGQCWDAEAHPFDANAGNRRFYTNQSGVIWFSTQSPTEPAPLNGGKGAPPPGFTPLGG